nr:hypothetical protein C01B9.2 - Caenorhabditis elegans [Caenorhabditis elegans]
MLLKGKYLKKTGEKNPKWHSFKRFRYPCTREMSAAPPPPATPWNFAKNHMCSFFTHSSFCHSTLVYLSVFSHMFCVISSPFFFQKFLREREELKEHYLASNRQKRGFTFSIRCYYVHLSSPAPSLKTDTKPILIDAPCHLSGATLKKPPCTINHWNPIDKKKHFCWLPSPGVMAGLTPARWGGGGGGQHQKSSSSSSSPIIKLLLFLALTS